MLKNYLADKKILYEEKVADKDQNLAQELYEKSGQLGVPFTIITKDDGSEEKILGFDRHKIDAALDIK
jgi:glutaredoxin